jgi:hypothetical protein
MEQHGPNFIEPPPDIIEGEPEWEVEQILKSQLFGQNKKLQYFVRWKGYSPSHNLWVNESDIFAPDLIKEFNAIRTLDIKDPLFIPEDDLSPFQSPLSPLTESLCPSPWHSQLTVPTSLTQLSSHSEPLMESSLFASIPLTMTCTSSPPSSTEKCSTHNSYGPIFGPTEILVTLTLTTKQSPSLLTVTKLSPTSSRAPVTF